MIVELGHFALTLALALSIVQAAAPLAGAAYGDTRLLAMARPIAIASFLMTTISFVALATSYATSDFSVQNVWENSHSLQPMIFKITSLWGNHEGSMLLWAQILTLFGALGALFGGNLPPRLQSNVIAVQGVVGVAFLLFILWTSNPFARLDPAPVEGQDLNPILQDFGLAVHPPLLYLGYVGYSICFAFAVAALIEGRLDAAWARWVRPWALAAWIFLTLGIAMGSYWAYYELGWGGFWFWDPVENASFMPWLAGTALLHSAIVMEKREALKVWTVLLAIIAFSFSLLGTFLVRSGVLTSVHAFATDPARGVFILAILVIFIGGSLALFALRAQTLNAGGLFHPISREGALVLNNVLLVTAAATVFTGTLYPLFIEALDGSKISVGAPFFNLTFGALAVPLLIAVPFGPALSWKRGDLYAASQRLFAALALALAAGGAVLLFVDRNALFAAIGTLLAAWLVFGALSDIALRAGVSKGAATALARLRGLPRSVYGTMLGHAGLGLTVLGIAMTSALQQERILAMQPGDSVDIAGYHLDFKTYEPVRGPNFTEDRAIFALSDGAGRPLGEVFAGKRIYQARRMPTTESGIRTFWFSQLYVSLGDPQSNGGIAVRVWWKPFVTLIWIGGLVMALGGVTSLSDRRLRVGAPARRKTPIVAAE
jgi:cytochrome c-type biogenesis protein CcmF